MHIPFLNFVLYLQLQTTILIVDSDWLFLAVMELWF